MKHRDANSPSWFLSLIRVGLATTENVDEANLILIIDVLEEEFWRVKAHSRSDAKWVLIRHEPKQVLPSNYADRFISQFDLVLDCGIDPKISESALLRPQFWPTIELVHKVKRVSERIVMVNSNQLGIIGGEYYSLRRQCVHELDVVDLFGRDWNMGVVARVLELQFKLIQGVKFGHLPDFASLRYWFRNIGGTVAAPDDKLDVMSRYKVALVIENSPAFMTEKLFDSFFAGCFPIYVGPRVENFGIPVNLCLQTQPNLHDVKRSISKALSVDYVKWQEDLKKWLDNDETKRRWSLDSIAAEAASRLDGLLSRD